MTEVIVALALTLLLSVVVLAAVWLLRLVLLGMAVAAIAILSPGHGDVPDGYQRIVDLMSSEDRGPVAKRGGYQPTALGSPPTSPDAEVAALTEALQKIIDYVPEGFISPMDDDDSANYRRIARDALRDQDKSLA